MPPLVSIVVPAYNNADYLAETLDSVFAQTYRSLEVIVADHSSTDQTWQVMERYADDPRVTLLRTEAGGGALRNWNRVSLAATGTYLKLVCGDDLIAPESVERQVDALESHPGAVLAASTRDLIDASGRRFVRGRGLAGLRGRVGGAEAIRRSVRRGTNIFGEPGCVLMRRETLERVGWWDSRFPYLIDQATYSRVLLDGDFVAVDASLAAFRVSSSQWSVRLVREQAQQTIDYNAWLADEHSDVISRNDQRIGDVRARMMARTRQLAYAYLGRRMSNPSADARADAS
ncbi:glycosyltransferase family 2 protein [Agromyces aureus]|uniref:Glycosyl transferase n=2 Tax=Agromyces aureus TaxID=453304 RepID=A0A191WHE4_9MICO|nr:glycosyltransferase family 2 protein [Agromyces aureus]ANJ27681.1 glycosyl transferase [Agromyces aureus]